MPPPKSARAPGIPFLFWAALPVIVGGWLRLRGIGALEPFVDEAGNILTAIDPRVHALVDPLGQGRPGLAWNFLPAAWFPTHALEVARLLSASAGLVTMAALGWTLHQLAGRSAAFTGVCLWAVLPFAVFHERLALQDPFVTALLACAMALLAAGSRAQTPRAGVGWSLAAGVAFGAASLCKISAVFSLAWLGLFYVAVQGHRAKPIFTRQLAWIALGAALPLLGLGGDLPHLGGQSTRFESLPSFQADGYWPAVLHRLAVWSGWYAGYGGWPLALLGFLALGLALRAKTHLPLGPLAGAGLALLVAALFYNRPFARYMLPDHLPLILFLGLGGGTLPALRRRMRMVVVLAFVAATTRWGVVSWQIGTEPAFAAIPAGEIFQYFTGPWSGRGLNEVRRFLSGYADRHQTRCLVLTHRFSRPGCYGLMLAELGDPRIGVVPYTVYEPADLAAARAGLQHAVQATQHNAAFFILYEGSLYPAHPWLEAAGSPARRVHEVPRGPGESFTLYQLTP